MGSVSEWSTAQVGEWLKDNGFSSYVNQLSKQHKIDGLALLTLTEQDLRQPPIEMTILGDIKRLTIAIKKLQSENHDEVKSLCMENGDIAGGDSIDYIHKRLHRLDSETSYSDIDSEIRPTNNAPPEYFKLLISYLYMFLVFLITAFVMVMVNDRVPDKKKYPPLPDLVLDNMPFVPWAFEMCEFCACVLMFFLGITLFFHKHR